jgi:hypothetical protein
MNPRHLSLLAVLAALLLLAGVTPTPAAAAGGDYVIHGGTPAEQTVVRQALAASSFDWGTVTTQVVIHVAAGIAVSYSLPGQTWLDANLLDSGQFAWGVVQMEYAQQVQFSIASAQTRAELTAALGARQWCYDDPSLPRGANGCERFAAMLAWAYWPSAANSMKPSGASDWSASMSPYAFRALLAQTIAAPDTIDVGSSTQITTVSNTQIVAAAGASSHVRIRRATTQPLAPIAGSAGATPQQKEFT